MLVEIKEDSKATSSCTAISEFVSLFTNGIVSSKSTNKARLTRSLPRLGQMLPLRPFDIILLSNAGI
jgi:hypothetical protein